MKKPNIILIVLDCLREDYSWIVYEKLKKFGFEKIKDVVSPANWTFPVHASMFMGVYPSFHKFHANFGIPLRNLYFRDESTIMDVLKDSGYTNIWITANAMLSKYFGWAKKADIYINLWSAFEVPQILKFTEDELEYFLAEKVPQRRNAIKIAKKLLLDGKIKLFGKCLVNYISREFFTTPLDKGVSSALATIKSLNLHPPFFLYMNLMEPHEPYPGLEKVGKFYLIKHRKEREKIAEKLKKRYIESIKYLGEKLEAIVKELLRKMAGNEYIIAITSDHGQLLGEYEMLYHENFHLKDELLKVPLILKCSENIKKQLKSLKENGGYFSLVDIYYLFEGLALGEDLPCRKKFVFAESYGATREVIENAPEELKTKLKQHRIALYIKKGRIVYNVTEDNIEEHVNLGVKDQRKSVETIKNFIQNVY